MINIFDKNAKAYEKIAEEFETSPDFSEARQTVQDFSILSKETLREAEISLKHYEKTGLHITIDEVKQWAEELKINRNGRLPKCHT